jgi:hypothetical protein
MQFFCLQAAAFEGWQFYALTYGCLTAVYLVAILASNAEWQRPACSYGALQQRTKQP